MKKQWILRGTVLLAVFCVGAVILSQAAENGRFDPDSYAQERGMQNNQAVFSDDTMQQEGEGEADESSSLWEQQDDGADLKSAADASWLFETQKRLTDSEEGTHLAAMEMPENAEIPAEAEEAPETARTADVLLTPVQPQESVQPQASTAPVVTLAQSGQAALGGAGSNAGEVGGQQTAEGQAVSTPEAALRETSKTPAPAASATPAPQRTQTPATAQPEPTLQPDPTPEPAASASPVFPVTDVTEPDPTPTLPADVYEQLGLEIPAFPNEGITDTAGAAGDETAYSLLIFDGFGDLPQIYDGQQLDAWTLLCSMYVYVCENDTPAYRLQSFSDHFYFEGYPETADGEFTFTVRFRPNASSGWIEETVTKQTVPYKVTVKGLDGELLADCYPAEGETVELTKYYEKMQPEECCDLFGSGEPVTELFMGWSVSGSDEIATDSFMPLRKGKTVLTPLPKKAVPEGCTVQMQWCMDFDSPLFGVFMQTLTACDEETATLVVPDGIQQVSVGSGYDKICIPASVISVDTEVFGFACRECFEVAKDNRYYSTFMGMLTNKEGTKICAIPASVTNVTVPADVIEISVQWDNAIAEMHFTGDTPPAVSLDYLYGALLYVPAESYLNYLLAWNGSLGTNELKIEGDGEINYLLENGLILSSDRQTLFGITEEQKGYIALPDTIRTIAKDGLCGSAAAAYVVVSAQTDRLEGGIAAGSGVTHLMLTGDTPPEITEETFADADGITVYVPEGARDAYVAAWSAVIGEEAAARLISEQTAFIRTCAECTFWSESGEDRLVAVSDTLTCFEEEMFAAETLNITQIGANAFGGCSQLMTAALPESVTVIGANAFAGCGSLELLLVKTTQPLTVAYGAFDGCTGLRAMACNAPYAQFLDGYMPYLSNAYAPAAAEGYPWSFFTYECRYYMKRQEDAVLLFGEDDPNDYNGWQTTHFVRGATSNLCGEIVLEDNTREIGSSAFAYCMLPFTIADTYLESVGYIGDNAFAYSGFYGSPAFPGASQVDAYAFCGCSGLESVTFSDALQTVGDGAFAYSSLTKLTMPAGVLSVGSSAVDGCMSLHTLVFEGSAAPSLVCMTLGFGYSFGYTLPEDFSVRVPEESLEAYVDTWKYYFAGFAPTDEVEETVLTAAEETVRALLCTEDTVLPDTQSTNDGSEDYVYDY